MLWNIFRYKIANVEYKQDKETKKTKPNSFLNGNRIIYN